MRQGEGWCSGRINVENILQVIRAARVFIQEPSFLLALCIQYMRYTDVVFSLGYIFMVPTFVCLTLPFHPSFQPKPSPLLCVNFYWYLTLFINMQHGHHTITLLYFTGLRFVYCAPHTYIHTCGQTRPQINQANLLGGQNHPSWRYQFIFSFLPTPKTLRTKVFLFFPNQKLQHHQNH